VQTEIVDAINDDEVSEVISKLEETVRNCNDRDQEQDQKPRSTLVRSTTVPSGFTTLIIPGIGKGNNVKLIADERMTDVIERVAKSGLISTRYISNRVVKGE
jgi:hypothetical protein